MFPLSDARSTLRSWVTAVAAAWCVFGGVVFARFSDVAVPTDYLMRPLVVAFGAAAVTATVCIVFRARVVLASALMAMTLLVPSLVTALVTVLALLIEGVLLRRGSTRSISGLVFAASLAFLLVGVARSLPTIAVSASGLQPATPSLSKPSIYLVLLDGYPRADTLRSVLDIDPDPFAAQLRTRGFDLYPQATSDRTWTELTLLAMLSGSDDGIVERAETPEAKRKVRAQLDSAVLPAAAAEAGYDFVVVDSPIGHVTFHAGRHIRHGGITDFEASIIAPTAFGWAATEVVPNFITSTLRSHLDASLESFADLAATRPPQLALVHLLAPHLPLLYGESGRPLPVPAYWPEVQLFESVLELIGITLDDYREGMSHQIAEVNRALLATIDLVIASDPRSVIVLFSDHGARFSFDAPDEWGRTFLASRTPGHHQLLENSPRPTMALCVVLEAYGTVPCASPP